MYGWKIHIRITAISQCYSKSSYKYFIIGTKNFILFFKKHGWQ